MKVKRCEECEVEETRFSVSWQHFNHGERKFLHRCKHCGALFLDPAETVRFLCDSLEAE